MNTQLGSTMMVVSGCFAHPSAAPVAGRSLAGQASIRSSPRYKVSPMVEESNIKYEFRAFCTDAVVVGWDRKLAAEVADGIIIKRDSQFQFNGHPPFAVTEIPYKFAQNGIHHRSDFILCAPNGIVVSHSILFAVPG